MEEAHQRILKRTQYILAQQLEPRDVIVYMNAHEQMTDGQVEHILDKENDTRQEKAQNFIRLLRRLGPNAFQTFYDALFSTGQEHLAELIEDGVDADKRRDIVVPLGKSEIRKSLDDVHLLFPASSQMGVMPVANSTPAAVWTTKRHDHLIDQRTPSILFDSAEMYPNFSRPKGRALVINNQDFSRCSLDNRAGSEADHQALSDLFSEFGYHVIEKLDLTAGEMMSAIREFASDQRHERYDSAIVVVMSHGLHGKLYGVDGEVVDCVTFVAALNAKECPLLAEKPKLFFLQACRTVAAPDELLASDQGDGGSSSDPDALKRQRSLNAMLLSSAQDVADARELKKRIPVDADVFVGYSTAPYSNAWRSSRIGSWFIQTTVQVLREDHHKDDLLSMMTKVNRLVADRMTEQHEQVPEPCSRLRKKFYFFVGLSQPCVEESFRPIDDQQQQPTSNSLPNTTERRKKKGCCSVS